MADEDTTGTSRRTVLCGVAAVGGVAAASGILAACGGGNDAKSGSATSSDDPTSDPTTSSGKTAEDTAPTSDAPKDANAKGTDVGAAAAIDVGSGKAFPQAKAIVTQPEQGQFKAFSNICTHMGCPLSQIVENTIECNCHGSVFDFSDGSVIKGPATKPLPKKTVTQSGPDLFVS